MWVGITAGGGIFRSARTPRLHQNIVLKTVIDEIDADVCSGGRHLSCQCDGAQGDNKEEIRNIGLNTLAVDQVTLARAKKYRK